MTPLPMPEMTPPDTRMYFILERPRSGCREARRARDEGEGQMKLRLDGGEGRRRGAWAGSS